MRIGRSLPLFPRAIHVPTAVLTDLSKTSDYESQIGQNPHDCGFRDVEKGRDYLFYCIGGLSGEIGVVKYYGGNIFCADDGFDQGDFCNDT